MRQDSIVPPAADDVSDLRDNSLARVVREAIDSRRSSFAIPRTATVPSRPVQSRAVNSGAGSGSGMVGVDVPSLPWGEALRQKSLLGRLGARFITGRDAGPEGMGSVRIPRVAVASVARRLAESETDTESNPTVDADLVGPKRISATVTLSRRLAVTSDAVSNLVADMLAALASELDSLILAGPGGDSIEGIANRPDVPSIPLGANGGVLDWATVLDAELALTQRGLEPPALAWIVSPKTRRAVKAKTRSASMPIPMIDDVGFLGESRTYPHAGLPDTLTKGSGTGLGSAVYGDWSRLTIVQWGLTEVLVNPYSLDFQGDIRFTCVGFFNFGLRSPEAFRRFTDIVTTTA